MKKPTLIIIGIIFIISLSLFVFSSLTQTNLSFLINLSSNNNSIEYTLSNMNNSLTAENITFTSTESYLRYLTIPKNSVVKSAVMNVSGLADYTNPYHLTNISGAGAPNYLNAPRSIFVSENIAYVASWTDDALTIFDVSNPTDIVHLGNISGAGAPNYLNGASSVYVMGDVAYVASLLDNAITTFNVSDPTNIVHLGSISGAGAPNYLEGAKSVYVMGDIAYVASYSEDSIVTLNVSNASNPLYLDSLLQFGTDLNYGAYEIRVSNDYIGYLISFDNALTTLNLSNASNIVELDEITGAGAPNYLNGAYSLFNDDNILYIVSRDDDAITTFNVSDPTNIVHLGSISGAGAPNYLDAPHSIFVSENIAYVASWGTDDALTIFDVSNPTDIVHLGNISGAGTRLNDPYDIYIDNNIIYAVSEIIDVLTTFSVYPFSPIINIGNDNDAEFNNTGIFNTTNTTNDFSGEINEYISQNNNTEHSCSKTPLNLTNLVDSGSPVQVGIDQVSVFNQSGVFTITITGINGTGGANETKGAYANTTGIDSYADSNEVNNWSIKVQLRWASASLGKKLQIGDSFRLRYDGILSLGIWSNIQTLTIYLPEWNTNTADRFTLYISKDGSTYWDKEFTRLAYGANDCGRNCDSNGNCNVPINITSTNGKIELNFINITYLYNSSTLFVRNNTLSFNQTQNVAPNQFLKRRFKVQPTSNLASNNISIGGYYLNFTTSNSCEINNTPYTPTGGYCPFNFNITQGNYWLNHYIYDINITPEVIAITQTNVSWLSSDILYQNFTLTYIDPNNLSNATIGLFANSTLSWNYNNSISQQEKIEVLVDGTFYDITPSNLQGCPAYEKKIANTRIFYTCLNRSQRYASIKIESSN